MFRFDYGTITRYGRTFQNVLLTIQVLRRGPTTPHVRCHTCGLGSSPFARHYWGNHCCFLFLRVLRCFSSPRSPHHAIHGDNHTKVAGLSHSEIVGSRDICASPTLFAAYRVLHRLLEPRHPPCALFCFLLFMRPSRNYIREDRTCGH